jgi:CBS domain-containing protein
MRSLLARDVMIDPVLTVRPDMTVRELATFLTENQISGAPVVNPTGRLVGVVSVTDIAETYSEGEERMGTEGGSRHSWRGAANPEDMRGMHVEGGGLLVRDIMTPAAFSVQEDTPASELARTMIAGRIHRLLVVREHRVVGIVTSLDLLRILSEGQPATNGRRGRNVSARR